MLHIFSPRGLDTKSPYYPEAHLLFLSSGGGNPLGIPYGFPFSLFQFYPQKGIEGGQVQLFLLIYFFGLGNVYWTFSFSGGNPPL